MGDQVNERLILQMLLERLLVRVLSQACGHAKQWNCSGPFAICGTSRNILVQLWVGNFKGLEVSNGEDWFLFHELTWRDCAFRGGVLAIYGRAAISSHPFQRCTDTTETGSRLLWSFCWIGSLCEPNLEWCSFCAPHPEWKGELEISDTCKLLFTQNESFVVVEFSSFNPSVKLVHRIWNYEKNIQA